MIRRFGELELDREAAGFYVALPDRERAIIRTYWDGPQGGRRVLWELATADDHGGPFGEPGFVLDGCGGYRTLRHAAFELAFEQWCAPVDLDYCDLDDRRQLRAVFRAESNIR